MNSLLKIKDLRKEKGLSQVELAKKAETCQRMISEIESGKRIPSVKKLEKIASELGVSVQELFYSEGQAA